MVLAFLITTVIGKECRILYRESFTADQSMFQLEEDKNIYTQKLESLSDAETRSIRDKFFEKIAEKAKKEVGNCDVKTYEKDLNNLTSDGIVPTTQMGYFSIRTRRSKPIILWNSAINTTLLFVLHPDENRILAENNMKIMIKYMQDYCNIFSQPSNALLKPDRIKSILDVFLPNGLLLFMNHALIKQLKTKIEISMAS
ncbi:unnamed protein product [Dimorphilus gyrociliatus]|uniref:Uncharacterized protein n=1 Tax=Dimorphilus gyrociliatus TaxID=2664684 RepID=A0A7I8V9I3_9ANNE|nr:unnamed protein product [Dimorphilus gyrociliatus]